MDNAKNITNVSVLQQMILDMRLVFDTTLLKMQENEQHHVNCIICTKNRSGTMLSMPCGQHIMCFFCCFQIVNATMKYVRNRMYGDTKYILKASCCICKESAPTIPITGALDGLNFESNQTYRYIEENNRLLQTLSQTQQEKRELKCYLPQCNQVFQTVSALQMHLRQCVVSKYSCPCEYSDGTKCKQMFDVTSKFHDQNECCTHTCESCWNLIPGIPLACVDRNYKDFR
jgi:hypothetical protein